MAPDNTEQLAVPKIIVECRDKLNFASQQNSVPILDSISISLPEEVEPLENVILELRSNPDFVKTRSWSISKLSPLDEISLSDRNLKLNGQFLMGLNEATNGSLEIQLKTSIGEMLAEYSQDIQLLARNEWGGALAMPELLPAYIMPNDPKVGKTLKEASRLLRQFGRDEAIDGYSKGSRKRVWELASAIYAAVSSIDISYALPPASFEKQGQKIRTPSEIVSQKISTCLDTALFFAAVFEQANLNPIIVLTKGHAFVGLWLQPETFQSILEEDPEFLRKRVELNELILIETTYATKADAPSFKMACDAAREHIAVEKEGEFEIAIDVARARAHQITPLSTQTETTDVTNGNEDFEKSIRIEEAPDLPDFDLEEENEDVSTPEGRLERWQHKLLDLTLRNKLLNFKETKKSIRLLCPDPGLLEDKLADGRKIIIEALPEIKGSEQQDIELHQQRTGQNISEEYARDSLERNRVLTKLDAEELDKRLVTIYRETQTALSEGGSNTLYLALGFLLWKHKDKRDTRYHAPLILLPVSVERKSVRSGVKIQHHDDPPRFNTTLLEYLRREFNLNISGLDGDLPEDHSGIDVAGIWNTVRHAVKTSAGFEVSEDIVLGHFSFAKYLMWKDLVDRTDLLKQNNIVSHLIDAKGEYMSGVDAVHPNDLDKKFKPSDLLVPLPADSSQLAAIAAADKGRDFVLEGPPGTGKSQTISNMISNFLGKGKRVLFVSEKVAALNVVHRRLRDIGLGEFCLELHSTKANKKDVLERLRGSWEVSAEKTRLQWEEEANALESLRSYLNQLVDRLHKVYPNNLTIHYAMGVCIRDEDVPNISLSWPHLGYHNAERLAQLRELSEQLGIHAKAVGDVSKNPLSCISSGEWSPSWADALVQKAITLSKTSSDFKNALDEFANAIGYTGFKNSFEQFNAIKSLAVVLLETAGKKAGFGFQQTLGNIFENLDDAICQLKEFRDFESRLSTKYDKEAWRLLDGADLKIKWRVAENSWWPKSLFLKVGLNKLVKPYTEGGKPNVPIDAPLLEEMRTRACKLEQYATQFAVVPDWNGLDTDPRQLEIVLDLARRLRSQTIGLTNSNEEFEKIRSGLEKIITENNESLGETGVIGRAAAKVIEAISIFNTELSVFEEVSGRPLNETVKAETLFDDIQNIANQLSEHKNELSHWCAWRRKRNEAGDLGLNPLAEALENGQIPPEMAEETFEANYCRWWSKLVIDNDVVLREFSPVEHERKILNFKELEDKFAKTTTNYIRAKLSENAPDMNGVTRGSEWGVLRREIQKKMRHKPIRKLMEDIPSVLTTLAPCMMMSPISIAQYLPAEHQNFDVVIFDEASQIPTWDAIGALARGKQVIVAGDPKQMPPTNFFNRSDDSDTMIYGDDGDLESILDELLSSSVPKIPLDWHYRSKNESLISFSNAQYYDGRLVTFPAPEVQDTAVKLVNTGGIYTKGARHNEVEAKAIVEEIIRRLTQPAPHEVDQTIGVVTFNQAQQLLIENLLDKARSENPEIESHFSTDSIEPVFVKNLETVQGDERDVILFSITYGPDHQGKISLNFGALSRQGGERRLNVAITRARSEMMIFTSMTADQIDTKRSSLLSTRDLKLFLDFAQRGVAALREINEDSVGSYDSPFEVAVARALRAKNWEVFPQIGVSRFRIDLGVVHPEKPGRYLAGVECDGATYHSAATARDRDKIRQAILEGLGWSITRVWSTDWWTNPEQAIEKVDAYLKEALDLDHLKDELEAEEEAKHQEETQQDASVLSSPDDVEEIAETEFTFDDVDEEIEKLGLFEASVPYEAEKQETTSFDMPFYIIAEPADVVADMDASLFYEASYRSKLAAMIKHVIEVEAPVHEDVLIRRIARAHGFKKAGAKIRDVLDHVAKRVATSRIEHTGKFYVGLQGQNKCTVVARNRASQDEMKKFEHISDEEISLMAKAIFASGDDGPTAVSRAFGISRLTEEPRKRIETLIKFL